MYLPAPSELIGVWQILAFIFMCGMSYLLKCPEFNILCILFYTVHFGTAFLFIRK